MPNPTFKNKTFILLLVLVTVAFFWILLPFYGAIFWAVVLAVLFSPLQDRLIRRTGGRGNLSALLTLAICLLVADQLRDFSNREEGVVSRGWGLQRTSNVCDGAVLGAPRGDRETINLLAALSNLAQLLQGSTRLDATENL